MFVVVALFCALTVHAQVDLTGNVTCVILEPVDAQVTACINWTSAIATAQPRHYAHVFPYYDVADQVQDEKSVACAG